MAAGAGGLYCTVLYCTVLYCTVLYWLQVLAGWLNSAPNYEEVVSWYSGWKSSLPPAVLPLPGVADHLSQALHMMNRSVVCSSTVQYITVHYSIAQHSTVMHMNRSVSGGGPMSGQPGALENVMYMTNLEMKGQAR